MSVLDVINYLRERNLPRSAKQIALVFQTDLRKVCFTLHIMHEEKLVFRHKSSKHNGFEYVLAGGLALS